MESVTTVRSLRRRLRWHCWMGWVGMKTSVVLHVTIWCWLMVTISASVAWCPNRCSGNGYCGKDTKGVCQCYPGYIGVDCSQFVCASHNAWVDFPSSNNTAHAPFTECSNMGTCDRSTGLCKCRSGFTGPACERLTCPLGLTQYGLYNFIKDYQTCGGNGRCVSLREYSVFETVADSFDNTEYDGWDADKIFGCVCDEGWEGPACTERVCPKGVDPVVTQNQNPVYEVQFIECQCSNCRGGMHIELDTEVSGFIPFDATAPLVQRELEAFQGVDAVDVRLLQGDGICSEGAGSVLQIMFLQPRGPINRLKTILAQGLSGPYIAVRAKGQNARLLNYRIASTESNEILHPCSNRGTCNVNTGACTCQKGYRNSDGYGNPGLRGDCGYQEDKYSLYSYEVDDLTLNVSSSCFVNAKGHVCNGHGRCNDEKGQCECQEGYEGFNCGDKQCPQDYAWFGAVGLDHKQLISECSGIGHCNRTVGVCECMHEAFGGKACERLTCAKDIETNKVCSGQGVCLPMWHLALYAYTPSKELARNVYYDDAWDAGKIYGCLCDRAISVDGQYDDTYLSLQPFKSATTFFNLSLAINDTTSNMEMGSTALLTANDFTRFQRSPFAKAATDYFGYLCSQKKCPTGDVPTLYNHEGDHELHKNEIQEIICRANNGSFTFTFRENTTLPISFNATTEELKYRLEQLFTIGTVAVTISGEKYAEYGNMSTVCSYERNTSVLVEFLTEHGDVPLLLADVSRLDMNGEHVFDSIYTGNFLMNVTEIQKGTTQDVECSGMGICDYEKGVCRCMEGFFSSNGSIYAAGETGDCSYFNRMYTVETLVHGDHRRKKRRGLDTNA